MKKAPRLIPLDHQDKAFFDEWNASSIQEKIRSFDNSVFRFISLITMVDDPGMNGPEQQKAKARSSRLYMRDLIQYARLLNAHLEQIEVTGEWK